MSPVPLIVDSGEISRLESILNLGDPAPITLISNQLVITKSVHYINNVIGSNTVTNVLGAENGDLLILGKTVNPTITLSTSGNLHFPRNARLFDDTDSIMMIYTGLGWIQLSFTS